MLRRVTFGLLGIALGSGAGLALSSAGAAPSAPHIAPINFGSPTWTKTITVASNGTLSHSSPNLAMLPQGPAVVFGDRSDVVYALDLATGNEDWNLNVGAPVESTPSVAALTAGSPDDTVFVGSGDAASPNVGGYQAITPQGASQWFVQETNPTSDPTPHNAVSASLAVGNLQGQTDVTAGSLGQDQLALNASNGSTLSGFPWFQADSDYSTPALADLYSSGQTDIVEGGASTAAANVYGETYTKGGHIRVLSPTGNAGQAEPNEGLSCQYNTTEEVDSSPAVGEFFDGSPKVGIVDGTSDDFGGQSDSDNVIALDSHCNKQWETALTGSTAASPVLADVMGNGNEQVIEGTDAGSNSGSVYALDGATGNILWQTQVGQVDGSVATADFGEGYQDVVVPTNNGVDVLDGKTGSIINTLLTGVGFQNAPLITDDPNGTIGVTLAGFQGNNDVITHYEIAGSNGSLVNETGAWPQFHLNPQLTGDTGTVQSIQVPCKAPASPYGYYLAASDGGIFNYGNLPFCGSTGAITINKPMVGLAATKDGGGYWEVASDGGIFGFGDATFHGSAGNIALNKPIVGMAVTHDGGGYWEVASDGGIFSYGDAAFHGSAGSIALNKAIVGMAATPDGGGYWEVASDGGIFSYGDAAFHGSSGNIVLNKPIVGMAVTPSGLGYWLVASDGGIFAYGDAQFYGSTGNEVLNKPVVAMSGV